MLPTLYLYRRYFCVFGYWHSILIQRQPKRQTTKMSKKENNFYIPTVKLAGIGFLVAAFCATLPLDGNYKGITDYATFYVLAAHCFATSLFFISPNREYAFNIFIQLVIFMLMLYDNSICFYVTSILLGMGLWWAHGNFYIDF